MNLDRKKITTSSLIRWAGLSAMMAGISYVVVGMFHQPNIVSSVTTTQWAIVHAIATGMCFFFLRFFNSLRSKNQRLKTMKYWSKYVLLQLMSVTVE